MLRRCSVLRIGMTGAFMNENEEKANKKGWKELFFKPATRDERVKDYVPEVLEESLAAQRAVLAKENTERDLIVEHGQKMLKDLENKAPVTNMFPSFQALLKLYKKESLVTQRSMHLLMYPGTTQVGTANQTAVPELVNSFSENFRSFVDTVEQQGSYVHDVKWKKQQPKKQLESGGEKKPKQLLTEGKEGEGENKEQREGEQEQEEEEEEEVDPAAPADEVEPLDITLYVKCLAGMSMANARLNDNITAIRCCDAALEHAMDPNRKGGVFALKAGLLVQSKKYIEAANAARKAIELCPTNPQGYLHGATAYRMINKLDEAVELLKLGSETLPQNDQVQNLLNRTVELHDKAPKQLGTPSSSSSSASIAADTKKLEKKAEKTAELEK